MIVTNLKQVRQAVEKAGKGIDKGAMDCRDEMMTTLIQLAKEEIVGKRGKTDGVWDKATAGQPPMNRTGNLRRSIRGQKFNKGFGKYEAIVGPTIIYGRAVELGGKYAPPSWKGTSAMDGFPYMKPAFQKFKVQVPMIIRKHLAVTK